MKTLSLALILLIISPLIVFSQEPDKKLHEKCIYPSVIIASLHDEGRGSGFIVYSKKVNDEYHNIAVTCAHVVKETGPILQVKIPQYENWSDFKGYQKEKGIIVAMSHAKDIAMVAFTSADPVHVVELSKEPKLFIGTKIFKIGYGYSDQPRIDRGEIVSKDSYGKFRTNAFTIYGDSGGPAFEDYKVFGLMTSVAEIRRPPVRIPLSQISKGVPISALKELTALENNALDFIYTDAEPMALPFIRLKWDYQNKVENFWSSTCTHSSSS